MVGREKYLFGTQKEFRCGESQALPRRLNELVPQGEICQHPLTSKPMKALDIQYSTVQHDYKLEKDIQQHREHLWEFKVFSVNAAA